MSDKSNIPPMPGGEDGIFVVVRGNDLADPQVEGPFVNQAYAEAYQAQAGGDVPGQTVRVKAPPEGTDGVLVSSDEMEEYQARIDQALYHNEKAIDGLSEQMTDMSNDPYDGVMKHLVYSKAALKGQLSEEDEEMLEEEDDGLEDDYDD